MANKIDVDICYVCSINTVWFNGENGNAFTQNEMELQMRPSDDKNYTAHLTTADL